MDLYGAIAEFYSPVIAAKTDVVHTFKEVAWIIQFFRVSQVAFFIQSG